MDERGLLVVAAFFGTGVATFLATGSGFAALTFTGLATPLGAVATGAGFLAGADGFFAGAGFFTGAAGFFAGLAFFTGATDFFAKPAFFTGDAFFAFGAVFFSSKGFFARTFNDFLAGAGFAADLLAAFLAGAFLDTVFAGADFTVFLATVLVLVFFAAMEEDALDGAEQCVWSCFRTQGLN